MLMTSPQLGFSPLKAIKKVGKVAIKTNPIYWQAKVIKKVARPIAHGAAVAGKAVGKAVLTPAKWLGSKLTAPIRSRVHKLRDRRAVKLSWDRRKSKQPNPAERAEAKSWAQNRLKASGPHGHVLALFAGSSPDPMYLGSPVGLGFDPATASVIAASIPVLVAVLNAILSKSANNGEAPADPSVDAQAEAQAAQEAQVAAQENPGAVDMTAVQDAAADAAGEVAAQVEQNAPAGAGMVRVPGIRTPVKQSHLLIAGIAVAGVVLVSVLVKKRS
jgi:hypothetical protein